MNDKDPVLVQIGLNMKAERARRNLSQEGLASLTGLGSALIARMERGEMDTGITKYLRVSKALQVDFVSLLQDVEL